MSLSIDKLVITMVNAIMFLVSQVNQTGIPTPGIGMDNTVRFYPAAYNSLQGLSSIIWDDLSVNRAFALQDAEDRSFTIRTTAAPSFYAPGSEV